MVSRPAVDDEGFVRLFAQLGSATAVAKALGVSVRGVHARRRRLERRYEFPLESKFGPGGTPYYKHAPTHPARQHDEIDDGCAIVFSDAHFWPGVRTTAFRALMLFVRELKPKAVVCNGDAFDGASISRHPRIGWDSKPAVNEELQACEERLAEIEEAAPQAKLFWPLGNHDGRYETRLADVAPQFERVKGFSLKDHFPRWTPCWSLWINESVVIKHRFKGGVHATHNNTVNAGKTMVTGHLHSLKVTPFTDYNGTRWGVDTGTLADPGGPQFIDYMEDNPANWRSGFVVLTFHKSRLLQPELARVVGENEVDFRGTILHV